MYTLIATFVTSAIKSVNVESFTVAQSLAEAKIEEAMMLPFASLTDEAQTSFSGDLSSFSHQLVVDYVSPEAIDTPTAVVTEYKRVQVRITHPQLGNAIQLESIRTDFE